MTAGVTAAPTVRCEVSGGIARITLDRPPVNVLDLAMLEALAGAIVIARNAPGVRAVLLAGAGKCFCAGVDVAEHTADRVAPMLERFHAVIRALLACEVPVVAAVHGATLGGGLELALACDVILARDDTKLGQPEIRLGAFPPAAAALLPRIVGRQRALDLILSGRTLSGAEAATIGLASEVHGTTHFWQRVEDYVTHLASLSAPVLRLAKRAVLDGIDLPANHAITHAERLYVHELMALPDAREGIAAWMEKRAPVWKEG
jgi:cyclohexa-1,5-dienecarbonyl-CoA hydratase